MLCLVVYRDEPHMASLRPCAAAAGDQPPTAWSFTPLGQLRQEETAQCLDSSIDATHLHGHVCATSGNIPQQTWRMI